MSKFPFKAVSKRLEELNGLTIEEMLDVLETDNNSKNFSALYSRLYAWRKKGRISFNCANRRFYDFKLTDKKAIADMKKEKGLTELSRWKIPCFQ